jgi:hypothetical protein
VNEFERACFGMLALDGAIRTFGAAVAEVRVRSIDEDEGRVAADVRLRPSASTVTITIDAADRSLG